MGQNPLYLTLLIKQKINEGGPPKDGGIGSGNWVREKTPSNPFFAKIIARDMENREGKINPKNLQGWKIPEGSPEEKAVTARNNAHILLSKLNSSLQKEFTSPKNMTALITETDAEFDSLFWHDSSLGVHAFCRWGNPSKLVYRNEDAQTVGGNAEKGYFSNTETRVINTFVHEMIHGMANLSEGLGGFHSPLLTAPNPVGKHIPVEYTLSSDIYFAMSQAIKQAEREARENDTPVKRPYSLKQFDAVENFTGRYPSEEALRQAMIDKGINMKKLPPGLPIAEEFRERITLNKEEAVTELLSRKFVVDKITGVNPKELLGGAYQEECVAMLVNMVEKHGNDKETIHAELKNIRQKEWAQVREFSDSLTYGIEALDDPKVYPDLLKTLRKHNIISDNDLSDYDKVRPRTDDEIKELQKEWKKEDEEFIREYGEKERKGREEYRASKLQKLKDEQLFDFRSDRDYKGSNIEGKLLEWFLSSGK